MFYPFTNGFFCVKIRYIVKNRLLTVICLIYLLKGSFIMANIRKPKIGIVSLGHKVYWPQFEGLYEELSQKS